MQGSASTALGIYPPHAVRIDVDGSADDWPNEMIDVQPDAIMVFDPHCGNKIVRYPYVSALRDKDGTWRFVGEEDDFTVTAGPASGPSMDTAGPAADDWPYDEDWISDDTAD